MLRGILPPMGSRGSKAGWSAPERWAPVAALLLLLAGYAALGRGFKVAGVLAALGAVVLVGLVGQARTPDVTGRSRVLRWLPAIIPLSLAFLIDLQPRIVEVVISDPERRWRASMLLLVVGTAAGILILAGVDVRAGIQRGVRRFTAALRTAVAVVLYVLVLLPLGVAHLWRRADPMGTGRTASGTGWHPATPSEPHLATRTYRHERAGHTGPARASRSRGVRVATATARVVGAVVLVLAADAAIGAAWYRVAPATEPTDSEIARGGINIGVGAMTDPPVVLNGPSAPVQPKDPREDLPAMAGYPWRHDYFQELQNVPITYWPYLQFRALPSVGRYININADGERRSYVAEGSSGDGVPDVDMYGGSTTYGEGQRDQHTIASELARLAEADGLPIRAHNRGVRGWVNWQEMLLFEQIAADPATRPDLAIFYDGANEYDAQSYAIRGVPAHVGLDDISLLMSGKNAATTQDNPDPSQSVAEVGMWGHLQLLARDYRDTSAVTRAGRWVRSTVTGEPAQASAAKAVNAGELPPEVEFNSESDDVQPIYRRGQALINDIAERNDVAVQFFWQPLQHGGFDHYDVGLEPPTIDLSQAFVGHDDIFIDGTHHNEDGSVIAAEAIWKHLKPKVQDWYDDH